MGIDGGRISQGSGGPASITLRGSGRLNAFCFPEIIIDNTPGNSWSITPGALLNSGYTDNNPNSTTQVWHRNLITFTPVWRAGGTVIDVGNGSVHGRSERIGTHIVMHARLIVGSTTDFGAGGNITVDLVDKTEGNLPAQLFVHGRLADASPAVVYRFDGRIISAETSIRLERDTTGAISTTSPITLADGDIINISAWYRR
jgi:hypothetical protein